MFAAVLGLQTNLAEPPQTSYSPLMTLCNARAVFALSAGPQDVLAVTNACCWYASFSVWNTQTLTNVLALA